jgi:hypothetical protein
MHEALNTKHDGVRNKQEMQALFKKLQLLNCSFVITHADAGNCSKRGMKRVPHNAVEGQVMDNVAQVMHRLLIDAYLTWSRL